MQSIRVYGKIIINILICEPECGGRGAGGDIQLAVDSSASASWDCECAPRRSERCRPSGGVKVDVKAQSHSKLYNRAEESSWQSHWWDRKERERGRRERSLDLFIYLSILKAGGGFLCACVYPPPLLLHLYTCNMQHVGLAHWQNEELAIKMELFIPRPPYAGSIKRLTKTRCGTINNPQWALRRCRALRSTSRPRGRRRATTAAKAFATPGTVWNNSVLPPPSVCIH